MANLSRGCRHQRGGLPASATALVVVVTVVTEEDAKSSGKLEIDTHVVRVSRRCLVVVVVGSTHGPGAIAATTTMVVGKDHCPSQSNEDVVRQPESRLCDWGRRRESRAAHCAPTRECSTDWAIEEGGIGGSHGVQELEGDETLGHWHIEVHRKAVEWDVAKEVLLPEGVMAHGAIASRNPRTTCTKTNKPLWTSSCNN
ncbi:hypothetical protein EDB89DRAFT_1906762 [Lactarius sanguifluus]|nr:hypothetical protein EDB89DRAFT_1906762 [Lactarius sanguifluus]